MSKPIQSKKNFRQHKTSIIGLNYNSTKKLLEIEVLDNSDFKIVKEDFKEGE